MSSWNDQARNVIVIILGGGRGKRLDPLTRLRAKPAVPIAGKYRLIDIPISNSIHSGVRPENYAAMVQAIREFGAYPLELD